MKKPDNHANAADAKSRAADLRRVCRAWHRAYEVKVLVPGNRGGEGKEKGKGFIVRWGLKEAQSKGAGRRTGTGYEVWYTWNELALDSKVLHPQGCAL